MSEGGESRRPLPRGRGLQQFIHAHKLVAVLAQFLDQLLEMRIKNVGPMRARLEREQEQEAIQTLAAALQLQNAFQDGPRGNKFRSALGGGGREGQSSRGAGDHFEANRLRLFRAGGSQLIRGGQEIARALPVHAQRGELVQMRFNRWRKRAGLARRPTGLGQLRPGVGLRPNVVTIRQHGLHELTVPGFVQKGAADEKEAGTAVP